MPGIIEAIVTGILSLLGKIGDAFQDSAEQFLNELIALIVGTPKPVPEHGFLFGTPQNPPWNALYTYYHGTILPLSILLFGGVIGLIAFTGIFSSLLTGYERSKLQRRAFLALVMILIWWWMGSLALHFTDALAKAIVPSASEITANFTNLFKSVVGGAVIVLTLYFIEWIVIVLIAIVYGLRLVGIWLYMIGMPILVVLWVVDIGPLRPISSMAEGLMAKFVPLVFMTLPSALLLRVGFEVFGADLGVSGVVFSFISLGFLLLAFVAPYYTFSAASRIRPGRTSRRVTRIASGGDQMGHSLLDRVPISRGWPDLPTSRLSSDDSPESTLSLTERSQQTSLEAYTSPPSAMIGRSGQTSLDSYMTPSATSRARSRVNRQLRRSRRRINAIGGNQ